MRHKLTLLVFDNAKLKILKEQGWKDAARDARCQSFSREVKALKKQYGHCFCRNLLMSYIINIFSLCKAQHIITQTVFRYFDL